MKKELKAFAEKAKSLKPVLKTEESAKTALVLPFFNILGYDIFNPTEFVTEYVADVGIKKGEKVDYAILLDDEPAIIIETKKATENLTKHYNQLYRYFSAVPNCKFAILTNGLIFQFYTDCLRPNILDDIPFLTINLENLTDANINELEMFRRANLNLITMKPKAKSLLAYQLVNKVITDVFLNPTPVLVEGILGSIDNATYVDFLNELSPNFVLESITQTYLNNTRASLTPTKPRKTVTKTIISVQEEIEEVEEIEQTLSMEELSFKNQCILQVEALLDKVSFVKQEEEKHCSFYRTGETNFICTLLFKKMGDIVIVIPEGNYNKQYPIRQPSDILEYSDRFIQ